MSESDKGVDVEGIGKSFGSVDALRDISFEVGRGEVVALLGPNGAGKTTTVEILSTLTKPDRGRARVAGHDVVTDPAMVRRSIMLTGQHVALDEMLTGYENLVMFGRLQGLKKSAARARARELLERVRPGARRRPPGRHLLGRHAPTRRHRLRAGGPPRGGVPRRADHRAGSAQPPSHLGTGHHVQGRRHRDPADHPVPGRGRRAQRPDHRDRPRHHRRAGNRRRTQGAHRRHRTARSCPAIRPTSTPIADALGPLLPATSRAAITPDSDRVSMPAPDGPSTLSAALTRLNSANIELADIALRRPSLDDVFLSLTGDRPRRPITERMARRGGVVTALTADATGPVRVAAVVGADDAADRSHPAQRRGGGGRGRLGGGDRRPLHPAEPADGWPRSEDEQLRPVPGAADCAAGHRIRVDLHRVPGRDRLGAGHQPPVPVPADPVADAVGGPDHGQRLPLCDRAGRRAGVRLRHRLPVSPRTVVRRRVLSAGACSSAWRWR